jgi:hypothetical protein
MLNYKAGTLEVGKMKKLNRYRYVVKTNRTFLVALFRIFLFFMMIVCKGHKGNFFILYIVML